MVMKTRTAIALGIAAGAVGISVLAAAAGFFVVYSGSFNVAATEEHTPFTRWVLGTTFHNSVKSRAAELRPPSNFTPEMVAAGARSYKAMCQHCHAGPGMERAEWASGMRPLPPQLVEAASEWRSSELFWLAKHGVKMSGMPAFGPTHDDKALWELVAFVRELPGMTSERYATLAGRAEDGGDHGAHPH